MNDARLVDCIITVGPSLRPLDLEQLKLDARRRGVRVDWRRPIVRGDLIDAQARSPESTVLIIDGEFGQNLSVSVAEIRNVCLQGVPVHGASSMGALRAVECSNVGMIGHGWVFDQYHAGSVDADSDVALLYDPDTFEPATIPMINVRWLVHRLVGIRLLTTQSAQVALEVAQDIFYANRLPHVLAMRWLQALSDDAAPLVSWLEPDQILLWDRKRIDALNAIEWIISKESRNKCST